MKFKGVVGGRVLYKVRLIGNDKFQFSISLPKRVSPENFALSTPLPSTPPLEQ